MSSVRKSTPQTSSPIAFAARAAISRLSGWTTSVTSTAVPPVERFPVESGHVLMFARAIGDPNPVYSDPEHAAGTEVGGIIAPPTFVQASAQFDPDYGLRPRIGRPWLATKNP